MSEAGRTAATPSVVETHELAELRHHWGDAYVITYDPGADEYGWRAGRRDKQGGVVAETADDLFDKIHRDYSARPVPRQYSVDE